MASSGEEVEEGILAAPLAGHNEDAGVREDAEKVAECSRSGVIYLSAHRAP